MIMEPGRRDGNRYEFSHLWDSKFSQVFFYPFLRMTTEYPLIAVWEEKPKWRKS